MADKITKIYALLDPRTSECRYVGKTCQPLNVRFTCHIRDKRPSRKINWIKSLVALGLKPRMEVLEILTQDSVAKDWEEAERFWISCFRFMGSDLTNLTDGGEGLCGHTLTDSHKRKIGDRFRGRKLSPEHLANLAEARRGLCYDHLRQLAASQKGKPLSEAHRLSLGKSWLGRKHTPETIAKMSASAMGRKCSAEVRANMSEAQKNRTPEHQEKLNARKRGCTLSPEHRAKIGAAHLGRKHAPETIERMRAAQQRRYQNAHS